MPAAFGIEALAMTKRFGAFTALDDVSLKVPPGSFHALLGENGAGKSTLVKCIMGYYRPDQGRVIVDGREQAIANPRAAHALGLGMVYQHFTLVPAMTVTENLVLARDELPPVIDCRYAIRSASPSGVRLLTNPSGIIDCFRMARDSIWASSSSRWIPVLSRINTLLARSLTTKPV